MPFSMHKSARFVFKMTCLSTVYSFTLVSSPIYAQNIDEVIRQDPIAAQTPSPKEETKEEAYVLPKQALTPQIVFGTLLGNTLLQRDQPQKAYAVYMEMATQTRDPRYADLAYRISTALGSEEEALMAAALLKQLAPNATLGQDLQRHLQLEYAYKLIDAQQYRPAYNAAKQILISNPDNVPALSLLANVSDRLGYDKEALSTLERLLKIDKNNPESQNDLGYFLTEKNMRLNEAERLLKQAHEKLPNAAHVTDSLAWLAYRQGRLNDAQTLAEKSLRQKTEPETMIHYGEILWMNNRHEQALEVLKEAYTLAPYSSTLRDTLERLSIPVSDFDTQNFPSTTNKQNN